MALPMISVHNMKSFHIVSIVSLSRCLPWRAALHRGPVLSEPVPKQRHMQSTRGRLLVLLRARLPGRPLPDWREWVCLGALPERRHLRGQSWQLLLSVPSWVHRWVSRTLSGNLFLVIFVQRENKRGGRIWQNQRQQGRRVWSHQNRIELIIFLVFWHVHFQHGSDVISWQNMPVVTWELQT